MSVNNISLIDYEAPVEFHAYKKTGAYSKPVLACETRKMPSQALIDDLTSRSKLHLIGETLQSLSYRTSDRKTLMTAFPSMDEFIRHGGDRYIDKEILNQWMSNGCNEINIVFEKRNSFEPKQ